MKTNDIFPMERTDLEQVMHLSDQLGYPGKMSDFQTRFEAIKSLPHHALFVYRSNEKVLGWVHLEIVTDLIEKTMVEMKAIVVDENLRGKSIGHKLVDFSKSWAKNQGLDTIYLSCNIIRNKSHRFYEREGFKKNKTSLFFILDL